MLIGPFRAERRDSLPFFPHGLFYGSTIEAPHAIIHPDRSIIFQAVKLVQHLKSSATWTIHTIHDDLLVSYDLPYEMAVPPQAYWVG